MNDEKLYDSAAELWRYFASWREKLFAGYLTVVGALAFAFVQQSSPGRQCIVLLAMILMSIVFWLHDVRVRELFSAMQGVAAGLESKVGGYRALDAIRFSGTSPITHGVAINLLVTSIVASCVGGLAVLLPRWFVASGETPAITLAVATGTLCLSYVITHKLGRVERRAEQRLRHLLSPSKPLSGGIEQVSDESGRRPTSRYL